MNIISALTSRVSATPYGGSQPFARSNQVRAESEDAIRISLKKQRTPDNLSIEQLEKLEKERNEGTLGKVLTGAKNLLLDIQKLHKQANDGAIPSTQKAAIYSEIAQKAKELKKLTGGDDLQKLKKQVLDAYADLTKAGAKPAEVAGKYLGMRESLGNNFLGLLQRGDSSAVGKIALGLDELTKLEEEKLISDPDATTHAISTIKDLEKVLSGPPLDEAQLNKDLNLAIKQSGAAAEGLAGIVEKIASAPANLVEDMIQAIPDLDPLRARDLLVDHDDTPSATVKSE